MVIANSSVGMTSTHAYAQSSLSMTTIRHKVADSQGKENYLGFYQNLLNQRQNTQGLNVNSGGNQVSGLSSISQIKLRVWTKDEYGNDELVDLKSADVGAIFLVRNFIGRSRDLHVLRDKVGRGGFGLFAVASHYRDI